MMKKLDKLLAILVTACLTATMAASTAFALNQTARPLENTTTATEPVPNDPTTDSSTGSESSTNSSENSTSSVNTSIESGVNTSSESNTPKPTSGNNSNQSTTPSTSSKPASPSSSSKKESSTPSRKPQSSSSESNYRSSSNNLLPGNSSHSLSEANSYDWNQLLNNIDSNGSTVSVVSDNGGGFFNNNQSSNSGGSWLLIGGIALIIVALGGIGYVIFSQVRARKNDAALTDMDGLSGDVPVDATSDTIAFDSVGGDYGDDYDYAAGHDAGDGDTPTTDMYDQAPEETTDINSYSQEPEELYDDLDYPQETGYSQGESVEETPNPEDLDTSFKEATITDKAEALSQSEPEEIFSDSSLQNGSTKSETDNLPFEEEPSNTSKLHKESLEDDDAFDLQYSSSKSNGENQSPAQNHGKGDDFWDKFFHS